jgi:2-dehydro-3-deoxyphosphooctonate aldolase (KDO 8-P synthase)
LNTNSAAAPVVTLGPVKFGNDLPLAVIAGPCQLESRAHALEVASALKEIAQRLKIGLVYKTSTRPPSTRPTAPAPVLRVASG